MDDKIIRKLILSFLGAVIAGGLCALALWAMGTAITRALYSGLAIALGVILVQLVSFFLQSKKGKPLILSL